jgi:hypothetical protein
MKTVVRRLFALDLRSLALFRILLALVLLVDLARRARDLQAHYSDEGVLPRDVLIRYGLRRGIVSLHLVNGSPVGQAILFALAASFGLGLLLGYRTRLAALGSWALLLSVQNRNPLVLYGADDLLRMLLFWSVFLPLGAVFSIDAAAERGPHPEAPEPYLSVAGAALLLQVAMMYWTTAALKSSPEWRREGTAILYALQNEQFSDHLGVWLTRFPGLLRKLTLATWMVEAFGPVLLFLPVAHVPARMMAIAAFIALHAGLFACMALGIFPFVGAVAMVPFLPPETWRVIEPRLGAVRRWMARWLGPPVAGRQPTGAPRAGVSSNAIAAALLVEVALTCLGSIPRFKAAYPRGLKWLSDALGLEQGWDMFSPQPMAEDGWYVVPGLLENGRSVDVYNDRDAPVSWERPPFIIDTYRNDRWQCYLWNLRDHDHARYLLPYGRYLCRRWNRDRQGGERLKSFDIVLMSKPVPRPPQTLKIDKVVLWSHQCF